MRLWWTGNLCIVAIADRLASPRVSRSEVEIPLWKDGAPGAPTKPGRRAGAVSVSAGGGRCDARGGHRLPRRRLWPSRHGKEGKQDRRVAQFVRRHRVRAPLSPRRHRPPASRCRCTTASGRFAPCAPAPRSGASIRNKIGVMGFSAGGHLTSTLGTHFDAGNSAAADSDRPRQLAPRLPDPLLPRDLAHGRLHAHRLARQFARQAIRTRRWSAACRTSCKSRAIRRPRSCSTPTKTPPCRRE